MLRCDAETSARITVFLLLSVILTHSELPGERASRGFTTVMVLFAVKNITPSYHNWPHVGLQEVFVSASILGASG